MIERHLYRDQNGDKAGQWLDSPMRTLDLFTGAGGLALGTHLAGFRHAALIDWDDSACETLRINVANCSLPGIQDWQVLETDARAVAYGDFGAVDLIAGGPPCQPFSIGGKHSGMTDRRDMIPEFIRAIRELTPRAFIIENVRGLLRPGFRSYFSYVLLELTYPTIVRGADESWTEHLDRLEDIHTKGGVSDLQYNVVFRLLNAADYGVPQTRERVFLVGFRADTNIEWHFPEPTHGLDALLHEQAVTGEYWDRHQLPTPTRIPEWLGLRGNATLPLQLDDRRPWRTVRDAICDLPDPREHGETDGILNHRLQPGARAYVGHTGSALDFPAKTLKAGVHGVPGGENMIAYTDGSVRYFTVREAARLQTFTDTWRIEGPWSEAMRQLGNAVPVDLAQLIACSVAKKLKESHG